MTLSRKYILVCIVVTTITLLFWLPGCETLGDGPDTLEGAWQCKENSQIYGYQAYDVTISIVKTDSNKIEINNFYNLGYGRKVVGEVDFWDIQILSQTVEGFNFNGDGVISGNKRKIDWSYTVDDGSGIPDHVTATFSR